jgi:hypothetical protein
VEALRDFVTRTFLEQQKFDDGALFSWNVHSHFSVAAV